jgi:hypothetical protein
VAAALTAGVMMLAVSAPAMAHTVTTGSGDNIAMAGDGMASAMSGDRMVMAGNGMAGMMSGDQMMVGDGAMPMMMGGAMMPSMMDERMMAAHQQMMAAGSPAQ